ncbi:ABC transporter substrate-binding protein [Streptomyces sp. WMMB 322]|uniref:ABC transporter substrate-binding protein n=1 Tax=Streptomyces sp. WMMB 322 TaxID=1286821 RepID=UPI0006E28DF5|nr:ABC transporter substrate-binding protein [Streptomyces sp. WMMB 322]SCK30249.1 iron complex transport system substrate-binding protein [Streptomyces sp. WMMB 322]
MSKGIRITIVLALALGATACSSAPHPSSGKKKSGTVVRSCGQSLSVPEAPSRAVTLDQSSTETLLALGVADRMAGTSYLKTSIAPRYRADYKKVPVLSPKTLTSEQLRAANPDLAVASFAELYGKDRVGTREELKDAGLPSYVSAVDCPRHNKPGMTPFDLLFKDYENLGRMFRTEHRAQELIDRQKKEVQQAASVRKNVKDKPSVVWIYSVFDGAPYVAGKGGLPSEMSRLVGAKNAFDDVNEQWPEVSWEAVADRDPDLIVLGDIPELGQPGDSAGDKLRMLREDPLTSKLSAVRKKRILTVPGIEMDPSVRSTHTLGLLADEMKDRGYAR